MGGLLKRVFEKQHTFEEDDLFCKVCRVNRLYWLHTLGGPVWCIEESGVRGEEHRTQPTMRRSEPEGNDECAHSWHGDPSGTLICLKCGVYSGERGNTQPAEKPDDRPKGRE